MYDDCFHFLASSSSKTWFAAACDCGALSSLEMFVDMRMGRFLLFFEQACRLAPSGCLPVVFTFFLGNPWRQSLIQIGGQRVNIRFIHAAQFGEAAVGFLAIAKFQAVLRES